MPAPAPFPAILGSTPLTVGASDSIPVTGARIGNGDDGEALTSPSLHDSLFIDRMPV